MFKLYKCSNCKTEIMCFSDEILECCGNKMDEVIPNSIDASFEKHVPTYEIVDGKVKANVNHVMEDDHYIEWILYVYGDKHDLIRFEPYMVPEAEFEYVEGAKLYAYCNKHGLWMSEVK